MKNSFTPDGVMGRAHSTRNSHRVQYSHTHTPRANRDARAASHHACVSFTLGGKIKK